MFSMDFAVSEPFPLKSGLVFLKSGKSILVDSRSKIQDFFRRVSGHLGSWIWMKEKFSGDLRSKHCPEVFKSERLSRV